MLLSLSAEDFLEAEREAGKQLNAELASVLSHSVVAENAQAWTFTLCAAVAAVFRFSAEEREAARADAKRWAEELVASWNVE